MKKYIVAVFAMLLVFGIASANSVVAQEEMQVSPAVWVLGSTGSELVDIHIAIPLSQVVTESLVVTVEGHGEVDLIWIGDDSLGDLVIKFLPPELDELDVGIPLTVKVEGFYINGESLGENLELMVEVKEIDPWYYNFKKD